MVHMFIHPAFGAHLYYLSSVVESCIYYIAWVSQDPMNHSVGQRGWARIESFPYRNRPMHLLTSCSPKVTSGSGIPYALSFCIPTL